MGRLPASLVLLPLLYSLAFAGEDAEKPTDLPLLLHEDFEQGADRWEPTDPKAWKITSSDKGKVYSQFKQSSYKPPFRSPLNISLLKDVVVGDFILEASLQSTVKDYGHRDLCLFFGYQDPAHFYYVHLGKKTDDHANQIFIVNNAARLKISTKTTEGTNWDDAWHKVKVVRRAGDGAIQVFLDDMKSPIMMATDRTFSWGRIGIGSFDDTGNWDDIKLYGLKAKGTPAAASASISTLAGTGQGGFRGDGGQAKEALLNQPFHCEWIKREGAPLLLVAEAYNHCIRQIDLRTGVVSTIAGSGQKGYSGDGGKATEAAFNEPYAVVADDQGNLFIADRLNAVVRRVDGRTGIVSTLAGTGQKGYSGDGGPASGAMLREPNDVCLDGKGGLLIADVADWRIRRVDLKSGTISTFAGTGRVTGKVDRSKIGDGGPASKAVIVGARAVCTDKHGNVYICEREGNAIRRVDPAGMITTWAGTGEKGHAGDGGDALKASFNGPKAIRCDDRGSVFVVDTENHAIRRIDATTRVVTTVAGGKKGGGGDGGPATDAGLDRPHGCIVDPEQNLYIADSNNHRVRIVRPGR